MKELGYSDFKTVSEVVQKYHGVGKLSEIDHIATEIDHIMNPPLEEQKQPSQNQQEIDKILY